MGMNLTLREGREPVTPYGVEVSEDYEIRIEVYQWCITQFGPLDEPFFKPRWSASYYRDTFWFHFEKDREWFILKWTG